MSSGNLQPLAPQETLHPLVVHLPAYGMEACCDPSVTVATKASRQPDDVGRQGTLVIRGHQTPPLGRAGLAQIVAGPSLREAVFLATCSPEAPAVDMRVRHQETDDEEEQIYRGADHRRAA